MDETGHLQYIGDPKSIEEIACTNFLFAVVLSKIEEVEDICVPRLEVDAEGTRSLVAALVNVTSSGVISS
jgi:hypothetical protein